MKVMNMIKQLNRKVRFAAFDARTRLIIARFRIKCFLWDVKYQGFGTALAKIARDIF